MASKKFEKDSEEFQFFKEFYKFVQDYYIPENTEEYWDGFVDESKRISEKYRGNFYVTMLLAFTEYAEGVVNGR